MRTRYVVAWFALCFSMGPLLAQRVQDASWTIGNNEIGFGQIEILNDPETLSIRATVRGEYAPLQDIACQITLWGRRHDTKAVEKWAQTPGGLWGVDRVKKKYDDSFYTIPERLRIRHVSNDFEKRKRIEFSVDGSDEVPEIVTKVVFNCRENATEEAENTSDHLSRFIDECCQAGDELEAEAQRLHEVYKNWAEDAGERPLTEKAFTRRMQARGFLKRRVKDNIVYDGIAAW